MGLKQDYQDLLQRLKTERDEIHVRMHLAGNEVRDEWQELEKRWDQLQLKGERVKEAAGDSADDVAVAIRQLGDELKQGYQRIKRSLH